VRRKAVDSSSLASVGYDAATRTLEVEFRSGWIYHYQEVGADLFQRLMTAESKGRFMNAHIPTAYRFTRVR
jgi:KTSC domain